MRTPIRPPVESENLSVIPLHSPRAPRSELAERHRESQEPDEPRRKIEPTRRRRRDGLERASRKKRQNRSRLLQNALFTLACVVVFYEISQTLRVSVGSAAWEMMAPLPAGHSANLPTGKILGGNSSQRTSEVAAAYRIGPSYQKKSIITDDGISSSKSSTPAIVYSWFEQAAYAVSGVLSDAYTDTADVAASAFKEAARYASAIRVKDGLVHLPRLMGAEGNGTDPSNLTVEYPTSEESATAGASWSSASWAALSALPAYMKAVAMHGAPKLSAEEAMSQLEERGSIFSARRKGEWMGCTRPYHLVCKGVYRAIKRVNAVTVLDTACTANAHWLPLVIDHLRKEFRIIQLTCTDRDASREEYIKAAYSDVKHVKFRAMDPFKDPFTNETDLVIAVKLLDKHSMISSMRFFKNLQRTSEVKHVVFENYPDSNNRIDLKQKKKTVRLNTFLPPFMFGKPAYRYSNADEQPTSENVEILAFETGELFANKATPHMADLLDPKKRKRLVEPE